MKRARQLREDAEVEQALKKAKEDLERQHMQGITFPGDLSPIPPLTLPDTAPPSIGPLYFQDVVDNCLQNLHLARHDQYMQELVNNALENASEETAAAKATAAGYTLMEASVSTSTTTVWSNESQQQQEIKCIVGPSAEPETTPTPSYAEPETTHAPPFAVPEVALSEPEFRPSNAGVKASPSAPNQQDLHTSGAD